MPKFYGQNKKRIDPRYFLDETTNRDDPPFEVGPEDNVRSMDPSRRAQDLARGAMEDQIGNLSDEELQAAWKAADPYGMNPQGAEEQRKPLEKEMLLRFQEHVRKMTPEGGWALTDKNADITGDGSVNIDDIAAVVDTAQAEVTSGGSGISPGDWEEVDPRKASGRPYPGNK